MSSLKKKWFSKRRFAENATIPWHPFGAYAEANSTPKNDPPPNVSVWTGSNSAAFDATAERSIRFSLLQGALRTMHSLHTFHNMSVDEESARHAADFLGAISANYRIDPPRILPEDDGAVILTWESGDFKRYLTVDGSEYTLMDLNRAAAVRCIHELDTNEPLADLIGILGASATSSSKSEADVY